MEVSNFHYIAVSIYTYSHLTKSNFSRFQGLLVIIIKTINSSLIANNL